MLRQAARCCPFCDARSLLGRPSQPFQRPTRQIRLFAQLQTPRAHAGNVSRSRAGRERPRPSRMVLSETVRRPPPRPTLDGKPLRKKREPFSYLNRTKAPPILGQQRNTGDTFPPQRTAEKDGKRRPRAASKHALKMQRTLNEVTYSMRSAIKRKIEAVESFEGLPLLETVQQAIKDALPDLQYRTPTPAQRVAIPALLGVGNKKRNKNPAKKTGLESFLLAAETGSGKTLAYLLPTVDAIKREEFADREEEARQEVEEAEETVKAKEHQNKEDIFSLEPPPLNTAIDPARPRAIVLVPSAELVSQVGAVAKSLSHTVKFRAAPISAKTSPTVIRSRLFNENGVDIVISTPPLLSSIAESNPNILSRVTHLIIDEADSLFDRSFKPFTTEVLEKSLPSLKKLVLCSATIPRYLDKYLTDRYPNMTRLVTPNLHAIPRRVQLGAIDVNKDPYRGNKMLACADTIWQIGKASSDYDPAEGKEPAQIKRILVFVNEREDTEEVAKYLQSKGIDALAFHRDTDPSRQAKTLASFTGKEVKSAEQKSTQPSSQNNRHLPNTKVIVTTDLGSRGIDTVAVRHVILYDVPHTTIDFIHRLGRTGRMGRRGRGIVLVGRGDRADVVKEVKEAMFRGEALI
ncbi:P-loop containing nucleoside triphosphate hydrolase protein [Lojkania enalia]|uniref:RNA helicase n=1 Tax=Lojkania enalia TaxID=147567 RepID=A0A9P4NBN1_9PLEO|nr:P-loop containing nucleoside triphosphate hydrolase protein [Didymosphaeria enalia]